MRGPATPRPLLLVRTSLSCVRACLAPVRHPGARLRLRPAVGADRPGHAGLADSRRRGPRHDRFFRPGRRPVTTFKFLWAPLMDRFEPPWLGRRRGWLALTQLALAALLWWMASLSPTATPGLFAIAAVAIAFLSASQDVVVDAYRTDLLPEAERGLGASVHVFAYRLAMILSGGIALIWAGQWASWPRVSETMALIMAACAVVVAAGAAARVGGAEAARFRPQARAARLRRDARRGRRRLLERPPGADPARARPERRQPLDPAPVRDGGDRARAAAGGLGGASCRLRDAQPLAVELLRAAGARPPSWR